MLRTAPFRSPLINKQSLGGGISQRTIERLAAPKAKDPRWIPDKPSVYWLDYLIDPTPQTIKDPEELASYYDSFEPKYPRTRSLATPKKYFGSFYQEEEARQKVSPGSGVPLTALSYEPSERIVELSTPKEPWEILPWDKKPVRRSLPPSKERTRELAIPKEPWKTLPWEKAPEPRPRSSATLARRALPPKDRQQIRAAGDISSDDLARGDYASRSRHGLRPVNRTSRDSSISEPKSSQSKLAPKANAKRFGGGGDRPSAGSSKASSSSRERN